MASLGASKEWVNAQALKWFINSDEYIFLTRKRLRFQVPQKRVGTGAGNVFFTMLPDNRMSVTVLYTTGEVGTSVPQAFDEMVMRDATTKEVPENTYKFTATDRQGSPATNTITHLAKCTMMEVSAEAEGEVIVNLEFQILEDAPVVT